MAAKKKPKEDPRITALGSTVKAALARELQRGPIKRTALESLVEYLDYLDHARYSHDEIAAMLDFLVSSGLATTDGQTWTWKKT